jgi:hypothetical protein
MHRTGLAFDLDSRGMDRESHTGRTWLRVGAGFLGRSCIALVDLQRSKAVALIVERWNRDLYISAELSQCDS